MKIVDQRSNKTYLSKIQTGDAFLYNGHFYIKTSAHCPFHCNRVIYLTDDVCKNSGQILDFQNDIEVESVNYQITLK